MLRLDRHKFHFGPYRTPMRVVIGTYLPCAIRGGVKVVGMSKASIPWPIGERDDEQELVVYRGLLRALRSEEEPEPIATAWGITAAKVNDWRQALGMVTFEERKRRFDAKLRPGWRSSTHQPAPIATTTVNHRTSRIVKRNMAAAPKVNGRD